MIKYYKNLILCGDIDYFCLLCHESFELIEEVDKHIRWEQHRKLIKAQDYLPKFKKEGIFKIENRYYCEFCNHLTLSFDFIKNHIKEENHLINKANPEKIKKESLAKRECGLVIISKIAVTKKEFHCVINNQCMFCNVRVNDFDDHINSMSHTINLLQSQIKVDKDQTYRKINEAIFYCFKCKKTFPNELLASHWTSDEHCPIDKLEQNGIKPKPLFDIDRENHIATCILCSEVMDLSWFQLGTHRDKHVKNNEWEKDDKATEEAIMLLHFQDKGKVRSNLKKYGKDNYIKLNEGGSKGYCSICNTYISAHITNFRQHVSGMRHMSHMELKGLVTKTRKTEKPRYKTKPFITFFKEFLFEKKSGCFYSSEGLCISALSFMLMTVVDSKNVICYLCDGVFRELMPHFLTDHKDKLLKTDVITSFKEELIREIHPGLYHCGICNAAFAGWSVLEKHLNSYKHRFAKMESHKLIEEIIKTSIHDTVLNHFSEITSVDDLD